VFARKRISFARALIASRTSDAVRVALGRRRKNMPENEPGPLAPDLPRYASHVALPPYRYIPGLNPHPRRDPRGHQYGRVEAPVAFTPASEWRRNETYRHGVDLFNHAYFWEAHEAWEGLWHAAVSDATCRDYLKGMIQCAGAMLKHHASDGELGHSLARSALALLAPIERASPDGRYMGVDLRSWLPRFAAFFALEPAAAPGSRADLVLRLATAQGS
jgi:hypothetical protein